MGVSADEARPAARREVALRRAIFAACRARGIDEETRHALQRTATGKNSLSEMSVSELTRVLDRLNGGAAPATPRRSEWAFVFRLPEDRQRLARKLYRLAERIGPRQSPALQVATKAYVEGIARQMVGAETVLEFCSAELLHKVVQALEIHLKRCGA